MSLPPEICSRVVHFSRSSDLPALSRTSKAFQRPAEAKLYEVLMLGDPQSAYRVSTILMAQQRVAHHVRSFYIYQDQRRTTHRGPLPRQFWQAVHGALARMHNLEVLLIFDPSLANTWILDPAHVKFQLREAKLKLGWDANMVRFLATQQRLASLQTVDYPDGDGRPVLPPGALKTLQIYEGPVFAADQLLAASCPLTNLQIVIDDLDADRRLPSLLRKLAALGKTLRALSMLEVPVEFTIETMERVSVLPHLVYLGIIPLPYLDRTDFRRPLMRMYNLRILELEVSFWSPQPSGAPLQRALAAELRVFCPSLQYVTFWLGASRYLWTMEAETDEWTVQIETGRNTQVDNLWRNL